ncbi:MAG: hypothetical protein ACRDSN_20855, partial [Pseudonocardiaceae bacterium]
MSPGINGHGQTESAAESAAQSAAQSRSGDLASLYPFLYSHPDHPGADNPETPDLEAVLTEVRRSTVDKVHQIVALRREVLNRDSQRLAACASAMAASF